MIFFNRSNVKPPSRWKCRDCLKKPHQKRYFLKKKWKQMFSSEILVIDGTLFKNESTFNKFKTLPHVKILVLRRCQLISVPFLPNCVELYTIDTKLRSLPELPECQIIDVAYNRLESLPSLPKARVVRCEYNFITKLGDLPQCRQLYCDGNQLTEVPASLSRCRTIRATQNKIKKIPFLKKCKSVSLNGNPIRSILLNSNCQIVSEGRSFIQVNRFAAVVEAVVYLVESYDRLLMRVCKLFSPYTCKIHKIKLMKDSRRNFLYLQNIVKDILPRYVILQHFEPIHQDHLKVLRFTLDHEISE